MKEQKSYMNIKSIVSLISSLNEGVKFEDDGTTKYGSEILDGLTKAYSFVLKSTLGYGFRKADLLYINSLIQPKGDGNYRSKKVIVNDRNGNPLLPFEIGINMDKLLHKISSDSDLSPYEKAAVSQGGIYHIQPFIDGNKRTGRVVMDKILIETGSFLPEFHERENYIDTLFKVSENLRYDQYNGELLDNINSFNPLIKLIKQAQ